MKTLIKYGNITIIACIILEMLIWPSINNFFGCVMTAISWLIFSKLGLNEQVIREHTFAWLVFLSMSLYRILPLIATMLEGNSIGYNFVVPLSTYGGETLLYCVSALAFYFAINRTKTLLFLKQILYHCGFYKPAEPNTLWIMGILGLLLKIYVVFNHIEFGDLIGKTMVGFTFFQYAPILLFFPNLVGYRSDEVITINKFCCFYIALLVILSFATNTRYEMLEPIGTFILLFFLSYINSPKKNLHTIKKKYIIGGVIAILFVIPIINDISLAILYNRQFRKETNRQELFIKTFETLRDKEKMNVLRLLKEEKDIEVVNSKTAKTWSETYVNNFAINRYCNLKVADNTLYHAKKVGYPNKYMFDDFWLEVAALLPTPVLNYWGIEYDKNIRFSRGDKLKALSSNRHPFKSFLVTSHLADGLLTFGYWYFPIEFLLFFIRFLFLDTFLLIYKGRVYYSVLGLITIFSFMAMFRHAGGCCDSLSYIVRGYWQNIILFILGFNLLKKISYKI